MVRYHGTPDVDEDDRFERGWWATDNSIFAVGEPAGSDVWYPVNGHPLDKATYTMVITVPEPYEVVCQRAAGLRGAVDRSRRQSLDDHVHLGERRSRPRATW